MADVRPYCTAEDVRERLPLFIEANRDSSDVLDDSALESFCLSASTEMDKKFRQNGYTTPIDFGTEGESDYDQLLAETLKNMAIYGACGMALTATLVQENQFETNTFQNTFNRELMMIVQKGFPTPVKRDPNLEAGEVFGPTTGRREKYGDQVRANKGI